MSFTAEKSWNLSDDHTDEKLSLDKVMGDVTIKQQAITDVNHILQWHMIPSWLIYLIKSLRV